MLCDCHRLAILKIRFPIKSFHKLTKTLDKNLLFLIKIEEEKTDYFSKKEGRNYETLN